MCLLDIVRLLKYDIPLAVEPKRIEEFQGNLFGRHWKSKKPYSPYRHLVVGIRFWTSCRVKIETILFLWSFTAPKEVDSFLTSASDTPKSTHNFGYFLLDWLSVNALWLYVTPTREDRSSSDSISKLGYSFSHSKVNGVGWSFSFDKYSKVRAFLG